MNFLFMRGSDTEMLQTCYNFPVLFPIDDNIILICHIFIYLSRHSENILVLL